MVRALTNDPADAAPFVHDGGAREQELGSPTLTGKVLARSRTWSVPSSTSTKIDQREQKEVRE